MSTDPEEDGYLGARAETRAKELGQGEVVGYGHGLQLFTGILHLVQASRAAVLVGSFAHLALQTQLAPLLQVPVPATSR